MKLRYMLDHFRTGSLAFPRYEMVGVWIQGFGPGLDVEMFFKDTKLAREREQEAAWVINRLVESGLTSLQSDFLEFHRESYSALDGMFGEIVVTDAFGSMDACRKSVLGS